jgi:hypothetical protein
MLISAHVTLAGWAIGWACKYQFLRLLLIWLNLYLFPDVKYQLGWVILPEYGALPVPDVLWPKHYVHFFIPLELLLNSE